MDNTSVPLSEIIPGHHQYNIIRALCLWTTPVFHHQGLYLDTISMTPSGRCTRGQHQYSITRACTCGHHQYSVIRALYPWTTSVFHHRGLYLDTISITPSGRCTRGQHQYSIIRAYTCGHHQYSVIMALYLWATSVPHRQGLYLWTTSVFHHRGLYLDITTITSAGHYTCMTSSVYHHQCILPMDNINNYSIVRAYQDLKNISSPSVYLDTISITSCGHCT